MTSTYLPSIGSWVIPQTDKEIDNLTAAIHMSLLYLGN